jgi:hypothetical protein
MNVVVTFGLTALLLGASAVCAHGATDAGTGDAHEFVAEGSEEPDTPPASGRVAIGLRGSTLGGGVEIDVAVHPRASIRVGVNAVGFSDRFTFDGIDYAGPLSFQSLDARLDWFISGRSLRISPGVMLDNGDRANLRASVPAGAVFLLGDVHYVSAAGEPVSGTLRVRFRRISPELLVGWGNPFTARRRVSVGFEAGVVFEGAPDADLSLNGTVCDVSGSRCSAASDQPVQADVFNEQERIRSHEGSHLYLRIYPIVGVTVSYRLK